MNDHTTAIATDLQLAAAATERLAAAGVRVLYVMANGRRALIQVDRVPAGVKATMKRRSPNHLGGWDVVHAAEYFGCQIEALTEIAAQPEAQRPTLQAVTNV